MLIAIVAASFKELHRLGPTALVRIGWHDLKAVSWHNAAKVAFASLDVDVSIPALFAPTVPPSGTFTCSSQQSQGAQPCKY